MPTKAKKPQAVDFDALFKPPEGMSHVDDWLDSPSMDATPHEAYARLFMEYWRMPAWKQGLYEVAMPPGEVHCTFREARHRLRLASRLGSISLVNLATNADASGWPEECSDWEYIPKTDKK